MRGILQELFAPAIHAPQYYELQVFKQPVVAGGVYPCLYLSRTELGSVALPAGSRRFVLIRDLRDTLISGDFSLKHSHAQEVPALERYRAVLTRLSVEDGLLYLLETWLHTPAAIQRSWLKAGERCFRLEHCMTDAAGQLEQMFRESWGLDVRRRQLEPVVARHAFERLSGGRAAGHEDRSSHYRKGTAGDWRQHFTPAVRARFGQLHAELLVQAGYERNGSW